MVRNWRSDYIHHGSELKIGLYSSWSGTEDRIIYIMVRTVYTKTCPLVIGPCMANQSVSWKRTLSPLPAPRNRRLVNAKSFFTPTISISVRIWPHLQGMSHEIGKFRDVNPFSLTIPRTYVFPYKFVEKQEVRVRNFAMTSKYEELGWRILNLCSSTTY